MTSNGLILGFNSSSAVCVAGNSILAGSGGGVVIRRGTDSIQWVPSDGRYQIGNLAYSPISRLLCVTEVRLNVVLHVFRYPEYNRLQKLDNFARVDVQDMIFSPKGHMLAVLTSIPSPCITVFYVQRGRMLERCASVELADKFWKHLSFPLQRTDCIAVIDTHGVTIVSHLGLATTEPSVVTLSSQNNELHSCLWGEGGLICGANQGKVVFFDELNMEIRDYLNCPTNETVISILYTNTLLLLGMTNGDVFSYQISNKNLTLLLNVKHPVDRMLLCENGSDVMVVSSTDITKFDLVENSSTSIRVRSNANTVKILTIGMIVLQVCTDGSLLRYEKNTNTVVYFTSEIKEKALDACVVENAVVILYESGYVRCFTLNPKFLFSSQIKLSQIPLSVCASNETTSLVATDGTTIYYLTVENGILYSCGSVDTFTSKITSLRWINNDNNSILTSCCNGEIQLVRCFNSNEMESITMLVETVWRLDFPVSDFLPLYSDDDVVNILVHSLDKDTKLYVLERKRERDVKPLRPLFLMRDHESGGTVLQRFGDTAIISGGVDGKIIVRDISHYLLKLTPIPPSKEKRRPQREFLLRPMGKGGITSLSVWGNDGGFICGGNDRVIYLIPSGGPIHYSWTEPLWCEESHYNSSNDLKVSGSEDAVIAEQFKSKLKSTLGKLRMEVDKLLKERTSSVCAEDFLLPIQRESFNSECDLAIHRAKEDDYYHLLHNEFTQYTIRRECWDTMEVPRSKIVGLKVPDLEVHNFHRRKSNPEAANLFKKIKFLRKMQIKDGQCFTFSSIVKRPQGNLQVKQQETNLIDNDDILELLYDAFDVYTNSRASIQMILLSGRISKVKNTFNIRFDILREKKKSELRRIEERNDRCRRIMRQLGELSFSTDLLFKPIFDIEEDPKTVFEVFDSEIDPEILKLAKEENKGAYVISPSDEAALKTWMDGLEKDTEVLAVKVPLPAFADESLEQYVAPDERTDEQQKAFEEYEKQLAEQTAYVNERKEALREEMSELMKANLSYAEKIDEEIYLLRKQRMEVARCVDELESHQVNALRRLLLQRTICNELLCVIRDKLDIEQRLKQIQSLEEYKRKLLTVEESKLQQSIDEEKALFTSMRNSSPFDDPDWGDKLYRRFTRWRTKYEEGLATIPLVEQNDTVPVILWERYCDCCSAIVKAKNTIIQNSESIHSFTEALSEVETEVTKLQKEMEEKESEEEFCKMDAIRKIIDVQNLYSLRQGQVQDEEAVVNADFINFSFRWSKDILDYNSLIFASFDELRRLMNKISQQRQAMKMCSWETERLQYCVGTLEMELRQLHTLRVTRQMQESIHTGITTSREEEVEKLHRRIEYVRYVMSRKVEERNRVIANLKMQISDRKIENNLLCNQVQQLKSVVDDKKSVWGMLGEHNNEESRIRERMKELYENSELEELARCQQEELVRLKREIDRLRERTFPSFAVVSKKTVR